MTTVITQCAAIRTLLASAILAVGFAATVRAQEMPKPTAEHEKLAQFAGEWTCDSTFTMPGTDEPMTCKGVEKSKLMGGFWYVAEGEADMDGEKMGSLMTVGYDPKAKQYVGTFICSAGDYQWKYTGKFDETGKKLILSTTGPAMMNPEEMVEYQEVIELVDKDHKKFTSSVKGDDGKWQEIMSMKYERVKK
jgi:hypothetical protein